MDSQLNAYEMKRIIFILSLFTALQLHAQEQNNYMTNDEIQSFMDSMIVHKDQFIGKAMGDIYLLFEQVRIPVRHFSFGETSPWIDPEGKSYLKSIILYTETLEDMDEGKEYFDIKIYLEIPKIETGLFFRSLPSDNYNIWWNAFKQQTSDMEIKEIRYKRLILPFL